MQKYRPRGAAVRLGLEKEGPVGREPGPGEKLLAQWRWKGIGPDYQKIGGAILYTEEALARYEEENTFRSVAESKRVRAEREALLEARPSRLAPAAIASKARPSRHVEVSAPAVAPKTRGRHRA